MSDERSERLRRLLRAGDPAAGDPGLDRAGWALVRQRMLEAARHRRHQPSGWLLPATAAAALLALTLAFAWRSAPPAPVAATTAAPAAAAGGERQIQFTTDRGTLVVWVLRPKANS